MRALLLALIVLSGCVGELLAPEQVTQRTVACAFLDPQMGVRLVHHVAGPVPDDVLQSASASWVAAVSDVVERDLELMSWTTQAGPEGSLERWMARQGVLEGRLQLHVVWLTELDLARAVELLAPGFVAINATAWQAGVASGQDGQALARALLFHGLGHAAGVVNWGVPISDPAGGHREEPMHHEAGGVMSASWHHTSTFPSDHLSLAYSEAIVADWQHAAQEVCP